jgi:DNA-binding HxlR family transcriptional regulator
MYVAFVFRDYKPTIPPAVTYGITRRMKHINKVLGNLNDLKKKWQQEEAHPRSKAETGKTGPRSSEPHHRHVRESARA